MAEEGPIQDPKPDYTMGGLIPLEGSYPFPRFFDPPTFPPPRNTTPALTKLVSQMAHKAIVDADDPGLQTGEQVVPVSKERGDEILREIMEQAQKLELAKQAYLRSGEEREYTVTIRVMANGVAQALDRAKQVPTTFRPAGTPEWFRSVWVGISDDYETTGFSVSAND